MGKEEEAMWEVYIWTTKDGKPNEVERITGTDSLFVDWGLLACRYKAICINDIQYLIMTTGVGTWLVSEPIQL